MLIKFLRIVYVFLLIFHEGVIYACPYLKIHLGIHEDGVMNVTYDPTVGFTLDPINFMHIGIYMCVASLGEVAEELACHLDILSMYNIFKRIQACNLDLAFSLERNYLCLI